MDDLISRQAVIEINRSYHGQMPNEVNHRIWKEINELPSVEPEERTKERTETHACDCISRQAAIDSLETGAEFLRRVLDDMDVVGRDREKFAWGLGLVESFIDDINELPSAEPEIIRCKDCRWWDKSEDSQFGYCMAMKHGYISANWEIGIYRRYKGDWYCADAERRTDEQHISE